MKFKLQHALLAMVVLGTSQVALAGVNISTGTPVNVGPDRIDGVVTINGLVTGSTCVINGGVPNVDVTIPPVNTATLNNGNKSASIYFDINLTACPTNVITTHFEPQGAPSTNPELINQAGAGGATNVVAKIVRGQMNGTTTGAVLNVHQTTLPAKLQVGVDTLQGMPVYESNAAIGANNFPQRFSTHLEKAAAGNATEGTFVARMNYLVVYQ